MGAHHTADTNDNSFCFHRIHHFVIFRNNGCFQILIGGSTNHSNILVLQAGHRTDRTGHAQAGLFHRSCAVRTHHSIYGNHQFRQLRFHRYFRNDRLFGRFFAGTSHSCFGFRLKEAQPQGICDHKDRAHAHGCSANHGAQLQTERQIQQTGCQRNA